MTRGFSVSSTFPPGGPQGPEYLEQGGGSPVAPASKPRSGGSGKKPALIASGAIAALLLVGGGIWAATWYFGTGAQPAEALPDSTIAYVSIDLDPSGAQKIEAVKMLNKFPAFRDQIGMNAEDDIREKLFDEIKKTGSCASLSYADDVEPWLGDRAALAAVDTGKDQPAPVVVVQVKDADKADAGLAKLRDCGDGSDTSGGWAIDGDWAVIAETQDVAQGVADDAAKGSLSDDADYQKWTGQVGDAGVINMYAAPSAGEYLGKEFADLTGVFGGSASASSCVVAPGTNSQYSSADPFCQDMSSESPAPMPSEMADALKDFKGLAATVRFNDGALELELAGDAGAAQQGMAITDRGDDVVATLPQDTAVAIGVGFGDGWFTNVVERMASYSGGQTSAADLMKELSNSSGLDLPDDAETLAGDSLALSLGSDFDPETFFNSSDGSDVPVAAKVEGDPKAIDGVLEKIRGQMGSESTVVGSNSSGDMVAIGPNSDYRSQVLENGTLGDSAVFNDVVREADKAGALVFVNFQAGDGWLTKLAGGDQETADNLKPLEGLGISAWNDGDTSHAVLRLTTN